MLINHELNDVHTVVVVDICVTYSNLMLNIRGIVSSPSDAGGERGSP